MNAYGVVYLIQNMKNGKCYVGITTRDPSQRFDEHKKADSAIGFALRKHGQEAFEFKILDEASGKDELTYLEKEYVKKHDSYLNGYNSTIGGDGYSLYPDLEIELSARQVKFLKFVEDENQKNLDAFNEEETLKFALRNTMRIYLMARKPRDKINISKMIMRLKPNLLQAIKNTRLIDMEEVSEYSRQKLSRYKEVRSNGL